MLKRAIGDLEVRTMRSSKADVSNEPALEFKLLLFWCKRYALKAEIDRKQVVEFVL